MSEANPSNFLSYWGAGLSTLLALVKLAELWRDRFKIDVSYSFSSNESIGNKILIRNLFGRPIIIEFWEVLYCSGCWPFRNFKALALPYEVSDKRLEAHSTYELNFSEENYFSSSAKVLKGRKIFIRLYIAGRNPVLKLVYP